MTLESFEALQLERVRRLPSNGGCRMGHERSYNRSLHMKLEEMVDPATAAELLWPWTNIRTIQTAAESRKRLKKWWFSGYNEN